MKLLTIENPKTSKGQSSGYLTGIMYLSPASLSGVNLCPFSTEGCRASCLNTAGRGRFDSIKESRLIKTLHYLNNREGFIEQLRLDIQAVERKAARMGLKPCIRLNGTSDVLWERVAPELFSEFSHIQFYDYTKYPDYIRANLPKNYDLTFSRAETNQLSNRRTAIVFRNEIPTFFDKRLVINGDTNDLRFLDPDGCIVGLKAKGKAKKDTSGFVVDVAL
jgi:hypothetical protein